MPKANDRIGPYQLIRKLGHGAFGEVWLAWDFSGLTPCEVAVKMPLKSEIDLDALLQEATLWARATGHINVLEFIAAREFGGQIMLVSKYAPDGTLKDWLAKHGGRAPSIEAALRMTRQILIGLDYLHERQIIHRDLKPANIMLNGETPLLADFGLSRMLKSTSDATRIAGTPVYMAPEALVGKSNKSTDLWSVGVILHEMLTGRLLPEKTERLNPAIATLPHWLQRVLAKALSKDPAQRYKSATEMRKALKPPTAPPRVKIDNADTLLIRPGKRRKAPRKEIRKPGGRMENVQPRRDAKVWPGVAGARPQTPQIKHKSSINWKNIGAVIGLVCLLLFLAARLLPARSNKSDFTENINGVKMAMAHIPGGQYQMGSSESKGDPAERKLHSVNVPGFYLSKHEVTQALWKAVMGSGNNPSNFKGDDLPVDSVPFELPGANNDVKEFCEKLSRMTGKRYRLPSEAEWEYACRARTTGAYAGNLDAMAWHDKNSGGKTHPVGQKQANAFGLYDMHGNVYEWCEDVWHDNYNGQQSNPPADGSAWLNGGDSNFRMLRGGSWNSDSQYARSAFRNRIAPGDRVNTVGFRVAVSAHQARF